MSPRSKLLRERITRSPNITTSTMISCSRRSLVFGTMTRSIADAVKGFAQSRAFGSHCAIGTRKARIARARHTSGLASRKKCSFEGAQVVLEYVVQVAGGDPQQVFGLRCVDKLRLLELIGHFNQF